jgi:RNA polymerase sigma factor (sigma-70 family)
VLLEVFMAALERNALAGLSDGEQLAWLRRVAHNKCVDAYRRAQRQPAVSLESLEEIPYEDEEQTPEQVALRSEEQALLRTYLANLPAQQQEVLRLRFAQGLRCTEIARRLNKKEGTVRMLLSRALNLLRGTYEKQEKGDGQDE